MSFKKGYTEAVKNEKTAQQQRQQELENRPTSMVEAYNQRVEAAKNQVGGRG